MNESAPANWPAAIMRVVGFGLAVLIWLTVAAKATTSRAERAPAFGSEPVRLEQWASRNSFKCVWTTRNQLRLTSSGTTVAFEVDSRRVLVNGIAVHLS